MKGGSGVFRWVSKEGGREVGGLVRREKLYHTTFFQPVLSRLCIPDDQQVLK